jgi:hypothetical protein
MDLLIVGTIYNLRENCKMWFDSAKFKFKLTILLKQKEYDKGVLFNLHTEMCIKE